MIRKIGRSLAQTVVIAGITLACLEFVASFYAPPWPMRMLRPVMVPPSPLQAGPVTETAEAIYINRWGMRDRERTLDRPADVRFRAILIGDSLLEGGFVRAPLSRFIEEEWARAGRPGMEAINLGIQATGPNHYHYRIKRVALGAKPDAIVVMFGAGNDFLYERYGARAVPPFVAELPLPSILGSVAPNLTLLAIDRLRISEVSSNNKPVPDEINILNGLVERPRTERLDGLARHLREHRFPDLGVATIRDVLARGSEEFWSSFGTSPNRQLLQAWLLTGMISWETGTNPTPMNAAEADKSPDLPTVVEATFSWLAASRRLVEEAGIPFLVVIAPTATVDPKFVEFWRPWPRMFSFNHQQDARARRLTPLLRQNGFNVVDLRDDLNGMAGTFRLTDSHWNERGHEIVAARLARELVRLQKSK